ncbi:MAG: protease inhibitor I42 family protein [Halobacteria archaeon]
MTGKKSDDSDYTRRRVIQVGAIGMTGLIAGCMDDGGGGDTGGGENQTGSGDHNKTKGNQTEGNETEGKEKEGGDEPTMTMTGGMDGSCIDAKPGTRIKINLQSNQTTGFKWFFTKMDGLKKISSKYKESSGDLMGAPGTRELVVEVEGKGELKAKYARKEGADADTTFKLEFSGGDSCPTPDWSADHKIGMDQKGGCVSVKKGDTVLVSLPNNPASTGYQWNVDLMETQGVKIMENAFVPPKDGMSSGNKTGGNESMGGQMVGGKGTSNIKLKVTKKKSELNAGSPRLKLSKYRGSNINDSVDDYMVQFAVGQTCEEAGLSENETESSGKMSGNETESSGNMTGNETNGNMTKEMDGNETKDNKSSGEMTTSGGY